MTTLKEAMELRHTVRNYKDMPLSDVIIASLTRRIEENNKMFGLHIRLKTNDASVINPALRLVFAKGVKNYLVMQGPDTPSLDEKLGFCGADMMLYAQTLGLNTWWIGVTFNRQKLNDEAGKDKVIGVIAIGYGNTQGRQHKSKSYNEVAEYHGLSTPDWFKNGVTAALLAPTAMNKQNFHIFGDGLLVEITCDNGAFTGADLGLVKYHFALGAGTSNFRWKTLKID